MSDFDSPWKEALDVFFQSFLELFFPRAHADIDWGRVWESLDKELQQIEPGAEIGRRYVDKLLKVWLKSGGEQWVLVHVEVQMDQDGKFIWRMYVYNYRIFDKYNKKVASFAVLGDDDPDWRPQGYSYELWGTEAGLRFPIVKLLDYAGRRAELEQSSNPFATVVLAHLDTQETRRDQGERKDRKFRLVKGLLERGWDARRARQLFRLIDWMMELPSELKIQYREEIARYTKEKHMPFISTFEEIGFENGMQRGLSQGLSQGLSKAHLDGIEALLEVRFGAAGTRLMPEIRQISDDAQLEKILHAAKTVAAPEDLRRLWANQANP